ncbi:hypothetical protein LOK49_LG11G01298 [Camellia lanceoleosa]|uniref:Uncharacterized protein n=1 Tax=Camellia lanceoleosa TaxID=1840588 RepID=A0ACC0G390_9ERIC|nr:hypothetical protein LOK49_LG11G01298 [Camellia lanceoleosa]
MNWPLKRECYFQLDVKYPSRQPWGPHIDLQDSHFLALTAAERQFLQSEYDDYGVANSSLACIRSVAVILMLILLIRQVLMVTRDFGMVQELSTFFNISLSHGSEVLSLLFSMCWGILHRNQMIFAKSKRWVEDMASIALNRFSDFIHAQLNLSRMPTLLSSVVWLPPAVGVYKLNFDGAVGRAQHVSSLGAIAHNNLGRVMASLSE